VGFSLGANSEPGLTGGGENIGGGTLGGQRGPSFGRFGGAWNRRRGGTALGRGTRGPPRPNFSGNTGFSLDGRLGLGGRPGFFGKEAGRVIIGGVFWVTVRFSWVVSLC